MKLLLWGRDAHGGDKWLVDQELIAYRYSTCCCCSYCCGPLQKSQRLRQFKSDRDESWQKRSSHKYASTVGVEFLI